MNWQQRVARALRRGEFNAMDKRLSAPWISCAVGEYRGQYEEVTVAWAEACPVDYDLISYGAAFHLAVLDNQPCHAAGLLHAINVRIARLRENARRRNARRAPR